MKNILIFLFICFGFALNSQITITCYECKKNTTVDCKGCNIQSNLFTGIVIKEKGKPDIPLYEPYKVSNKSSVFTFEDAFGTKTIVNITSVLSYNTPKKLYDYLSNCLCKPSTIDTDTDRYSVLIQDSILVTYDINGVEIDRDTIRLFDIDTDTKTFLVQDSILVYYDIQNNEIGRDTIKIPFVDTDIQTYLTQDSILVYYDESNTEIDRDTIDIPNITEQGNFRISNDTLYHNNSIDGIEQFVKLPTLDTTTQSYLPILNGLDTIGYENITYLGGVEVDRDTITLPLHKNQVQSNDTQAVPYTGVEVPSVAGVNIGDTKTVQFTDGTVVNYTWDGTTWVVDFDTPTYILKGCDNVDLSKNAKVHQVTNLTNQTGFGVVKLNGIDCFGNDDVYFDSALKSYAANKSGNNNATGDASIVAGGVSNLASGTNSVVSGGNTNSATSFTSTVSGGFLNNSTSTFSFIGAGAQNTASGSASSIVSGSNNLASGNSSFIGAGTLNIASGVTSSVVGGQENEATADNSGVISGFNNNATASYAIIGSGQNNINNGINSFIGVGLNCQITGGILSFIGSGDLNVINYQNSFIGSGSENTINAVYGFIGSGRRNYVNSNFQSTLGTNNVPFTGQVITGPISRSDLLFTIGNGDGDNIASQSNSFTQLKDGQTQINHDQTYPKSQDNVTPIAAFEVVSTTKGFVPPRLTEIQANAWIAGFNTTLDLTGLSGAGDEKHSRQGEMIYCLDCVANDSTIGCTMVAQWNGTQWIAKKLW
jgi:hypothetical protein